MATHELVRKETPFAIEGVKLTKSFGDLVVLDEMNIQIRRGETMVIIGRSGVGKSVFLKLIEGILRPDSGDVIVDGVTINNLDEEVLNLVRKKVGMLFQGSALFDSLTVGENVGFALFEEKQLPRPQILEKVRDKLKLVGLSGIESLDPAELSGGMRKRVGLARAICNDPEIILYDEPTTGLDPITADSINDLIVRMKQKLNVTAVVVTHDMTSAYKVGDRIAMLYDGKIVGIGTPDEIKNSKDPVIHQFITGSAVGPITDKSRYLINSENHNSH
ncbi:MAG: ABC transporter ATP-binding protein [Candidatus Omnitrophica bacterium]|nr:ABC transporter ATP-binding protein [Candidatus Omnitrophota bacterium]